MTKTALMDKDMFKLRKAFLEFGISIESIEDQGSHIVVRSKGVFVHSNLHEVAKESGFTLDDVIYDGIAEIGFKK